MPKVDEPKKNTAPVPAAKMRTPDRVVRIANRATSAEKEAILDRHRRKLLGESPVETALEAKQSIQEPVVVVPPPVVEVPAPVAEVVVEEVSPQVPVTAPVTAATTAAPVEAPMVTEAQAAVDAGRPRPVPVDQQIAAEYRDRPAPVAAAPAAPVAPAPAATDNRGGFQKPPGGPKTREISPSRGPKKPVKPGRLSGSRVDPSTKASGPFRSPTRWTRRTTPSFERPGQGGDGEGTGPSRIDFGG
jgi:hypothetical protein